MGDPVGGDVLEGGGPPRLGPPRLRLPPLGPRSRLAAGVAGALAAVLAVVLLQRGVTDPPVAAPPSPSDEAILGTPVPEPAVPPALPPASPLPRSGTATIPGFLDPVARWELFARTDTEIDRIRPRLGRVTRTAVPGLLSTGPVSFVVTPDRALIRPLDVVPGVDLRDGGRPRAMATTLSRAGQMFPGPDPEHLWVESDMGFVLRSLAGGPDTDRIELPVAGLTAPVTDDGAGRLLVPDPTGVYSVAPGPVRRISTGALLAV
ncbi:MAG TPA: hypothetical protein VLM05_00790, partial [Mycobacteriales bacterium]|nr:hypothetical protein [Mycobacteriales bacterium]